MICEPKILTESASTPGGPGQAYLGEFTCALHDGLAKQPLPDDKALVARINRLLAGESIDPLAAMQGLMDQLTGILKAHVAGKRDTPGCQNQAARFRAGIAAAKQAKIDLTPWAAEWFGIMKGKQIYGPHAWTQKDSVSIVLDELIAEYPSATSPATSPAAAPAAGAAATVADLRAELEALNRDTAGGANQERINDLNRRIDEIERAQNPSPK